MAARSFSDALTNLSSEKIKDRTQGLEDVRLFLSVPRNLDWINQDGQRKSWLKLLQAIFQIVVDEQKGYVKKPGAAPALKRLKDSAQAVRLIIEKAAADIPKKAFKAVFNHIVSTIVVKGQLFEPVALEYLKALRTIISYRPHLDHLETKQWTHAIALCFSATLGDPIRTYEIVEDQMMDEDQTEMTESVGSSNGASRKRKAAGPLRMTPLDEDGYRSGTPTQFRSAGQDVIELMGCIEAFFQSSSSPFVSCGEALLAKFVRFFRAFPGETSAHLPALVALNRLVGELYYNSKRALEAASIHLWPYILSLWQTKNTLIKEQLVVILSALLPYLIHRTGPAQTPLVQELFAAILAEPESRWGMEDLDTDCLSLGNIQTPHKKPFDARLFRAGATFTAPQALAWAILELGAACLKHLQEVSQSLQPNVPPTPSNKGKKRKLDAPLDNLLDDLKSTSIRTVCNRLQLITFFCETFSAAGSDDHAVSILEALHPLLSHENATVQAWAMLASCTLAAHMRTKISNADFTSLWPRVWVTSLRKLGHPVVSRLACLLLSTLMSQGHISKAQILQDIEGVARDIEISGPPFPSDTICDFLVSVMDLAASDVRLFRLGVRERIYNRLANQWTLLPPSSTTSRAFSYKPHSDPLDINSIFRLLCRISSLPCEESSSAYETVLPDSAIAKYKATEAQHTALHNWFFHAALPPLAQSSFTIPGQTRANDQAAPTTNLLAIRIVSYLRKALESALAEIELGGEVYWAGINVDRMRRILDMAILALLYDAHVDSSNTIRADRNLGQVMRILAAIVPRINHSKWSVREKAHLLTGFVPLLVAYGMETSVFEALVAAGRNSGIRADVLARVGKPVTQHAQPAGIPVYLRHLWGNQTFKEEMAKVSIYFRKILSVDIEEPQIAVARDDEDFGPIRTTTSTQMTGRAMFDVACENATHACLAISMRLLVTASYFEEGANKPARLKAVIKNLLEGTGSQFALVGKHVFEAVEGGYLALSTTELDDILDRIGGELLPSYEYARSEDVQLLVLKFLQATVPIWGKEDIMEMGFVDNAHKLSAWFTAQLVTDNISSATIRIAFIELLDCFVTRGLSPNAWGHETEELACLDGTPIPPVTILIDMLSDSDFRARFKLAPVLGRLCSYVHDKQQQEYSVWESIAAARGFDLTGAGFESNISLLLAYANILVASDFFRSNAYNPLVVYAALDPSRSTSRYVRATLGGTATRLGLKDLAELYTFLAPYTMAEQLLAVQEALTIPDPTAFGFPTKRDLYEARFSEVAAMVLAGPRPAFFDQMCTFVGRPVKVALKQCLPVFIGYKLTLPRPPEEEAGGHILEVDQVSTQVGAVAKEMAITPSVLLKGMQESVVARLFSFIWEPDYEVRILEKAFSEDAWPGSRATIKEILGTTLGVFRPNVLSPPDVPLDMVLRVLQSPHPALAGALRSEAIVYGVLHHLLVMVASPPFVSQQLRLLYNAAICIAAATNLVRQRKSLLFLILHRVVRLLPQPDLFILASLLFRWALQAYIILEHDIALIENGFATVLVSAAVTAHDVAKLPASDSTDAASSLASELESALGRILGNKASPLAQQAYHALTLWPSRSALHERLLIKHFERTLCSTHIKFRNGCILQHLASSIGTKPTASTLASLPRLLWHFLSKIDPQQMLADHSTINQGALTDLLLLSTCQLQPPSLDEVRTQGKAECSTYATVRSSLIAELAKLLDDQDLGVVSLSYDTMKNILATSSSNDPIAIPPTLIMLAAAPSLAPVVALNYFAGNLEDLLRGDSWVKKAGVRADWQRHFALLLISVLAKTDHFFSHLISSIQSVPAFANVCIPQLVHAILLQEKYQPNMNARHLLSTYFKRLLKAECVNTADIVDLSIYLRAFKPSDDKDDQEAFLRNSWLSIPWDLLAQGAVRVGSYSAALLFLELAREQSTPSITLASHNNMQSSQVQGLLYAIYANLDEPDGFYSIDATDLQQGLLRRLQHEGRWTEALAWHAGAYESSVSGNAARSNTGGIVQALAMSDLSHLAMDIFLPTSTETSRQMDSFRGLDYDLAWKTEKWDLPLTFQDSSQSSQANFFWAIRATQRNVDKASIDATISARLSQEASKLAVITTESPAVDASALKAVISIRDIQKWNPGACDDLAAAKEQLHAVTRQPYDIAEQVLSARILLLRNARQAATRQAIGGEMTERQESLIALEQDHLLTLAKRSRETGHLQTALNAVLKAQQFWDLEKQDHRTEMETAQIMWFRGEHVTAINLLKRVRAESESNAHRLIHGEKACLLAQLGEWVATARLESALDIRNNYFEEAIAAVTDESPTSSDLAATSAVAIKYASFCDQHYQSSHLQLADIERLEAYSKRKEMEGKELRATAKSTQSASEAMSRQRLAARQSQQDRATVEDFRTGRQSLLQSALLMYGRALSLSENHEDAIFRFCSLWLANASDDEVNAIAGSAIEAMPSRKFVILVHQLSARLAAGASASSSPNKPTFQAVLFGLVKRLSEDHPYHTLFQLFFLRANAPSGKGASASRRISQAAPELSSQIQRAEAVNSLLNDLRKHERLRSVTKHLDNAIAAYIDWANFHVVKDKEKTKKARDIPPDQRILKLSNIPIPVSTIALPIDPTCRYDPSSFACIKGFKPTFTTAGGVHLPKITDCLGTDGKSYRQLYKGGDDVRQDAVMEQVFGMANEMLKRDEKTKSRDLAVRTYKVLPLTSDAGLLEFVSNSQAIGEWLVKAHEKYNPRDIKIADARKSLMDVANENMDERAATYTELMKKVHPVMRLFFAEKHYLPARWFEMRLLYSRSVAVMSMVGHVLGLGDRHVSNIMIDTAKGELIPIDLGIAFEAGKQLPTPELVPFRLTPDIVDGFGLSGVEGVFRKCSEETMRVLRAQSSVLMTILEVFKFDPLQRWTVSTQKAKRVQGSQAMDRGRMDGMNENNEVLTDADRAIATVASKLSNELSVEYQVNALILQATDQRNLGSIFHGWQPYL